MTTSDVALNLTARVQELEAENRRLRDALATYEFNLLRWVLGDLKKVEARTCMELITMANEIVNRPVQSEVGK